MCYTVLVCLRLDDFGLEPMALMKSSGFSKCERKDKLKHSSVYAQVFGLASRVEKMSSRKLFSLAQGQSVGSLLDLSTFDRV